MSFGEHDAVLNRVFGTKTGQKIAAFFAALACAGAFFDEILKLYQYINGLYSHYETYLGREYLRFALFVIGALVLCFLLHQSSSGNRASRIWNGLFYCLCLVVAVWGLFNVLVYPLWFHYKDLPIDIEGYPSSELVLVGPTSDAARSSKPVRSVKGKGIAQHRNALSAHRSGFPKEVPSLRFVDDKVSRLVLQNFKFPEDRVVPIPDSIEHLTLLNCSGLKNLKSLRLKHKKIHTLEISGCADIESLDGLEGVAYSHKKYLSIVRLHHNPKLQNVSAIRTFGNIVVFELIGSRLVQEVDVIAGFKYLQQLNLEDLEQVGDHPTFSGLINLRSLSLVNTGIRSLATFANSNMLDALVIDSNPLFGYGNLENDPISDDKQPSFPFPYLTSLKWVGPISNRGLVHLLSGSPGLFELDLSEIGIPIDPAVLRDNVPRCRVLKLNSVDLTSTFNPLFALPLRHLSLKSVASNHLMNLIVGRRDRLMMGAHHDQLEILELSVIDIKRVGNERLSFEMFPKLKQLRLERILGDIDWFSINSKNLPDLTDLSIRSCLTNNDLTFFRSLDHLSSLELSSEYYRLKNVALLNLTSIKTLKLEGNIEVGDLSFLSRAVKLENLVFEGFNSYLSLRLPNVPNLKSVTIERCSNLKLLDLSKNTQVTELAISSNRDGVARLAGISSLKKVTRMSLPANLRYNTLSSHVLPRQIKDLDYLKICLNQPVLY